MKSFKALLYGLLFGVTSAAIAVPIELALVIDGSGSISPSNWTLQMQGYAAAINAQVPTDGSVAVSVTQFSTTATLERPMTLINSAAARTSLANFLLGLAQDGGSTCISCGITVGHSTLTGTATRSVIDVSTDGFFNVGVDPNGGPLIVGTAEWAVANNADAVNVLGIGVSPNFAHGVDSFTLLANDFGDFQTAMQEKLQRELPEPHTLALLALGLLGMGIGRRRLS